MTEPITDAQIKDLKASLEASPHLKGIYTGFIARVEADAREVSHLKMLVNRASDIMGDVLALGMQDPVLTAIAEFRVWVQYER